MSFFQLLQALLAAIQQAATEAANAAAAAQAVEVAVVAAQAATEEVRDQMIIQNQLLAKQSQTLIGVDQELTDILNGTIVFP